jgi:phosphoglycolate phosphatase
MTSPALSRAVFFDVDGVLLDSLQHHLDFGAEKAAQYGLSLVMPSIDAFRIRVAGGLEVSPMEQFFRAVGFPPELAARGAREYLDEFSELHRPQPFAGVEAMLDRLVAAGRTLGLVTSNSRHNVEVGLAGCLARFDRRCLFFFEPKRGIDKAACLREGAARLALAGAACTYVGDQPADIRAAREAGWQFLGVTYGWGIVAGGGEATVDSVDAIADALEAP